MASSSGDIADNQKVVVEYPGEESLLIVDISTGHETPLIKANNGASSYGSDMLAEFSPDWETRSSWEGEIRR
jgi:hypothetical protein